MSKRGERLRARRLRVLLLPAFVLVGGLVAAGVSLGGSSHQASSLSSAVLTSSSSTFSISPTSTPVLYPGAAPSSLGLSFSNYMNQPIIVGSLTVTFTNSFTTTKGYCNPSALSVGGVSLSGSTPAATITATSPTTGLLTVPAASGATPGQKTYSPALALADSHTNQNACQGLKLAMSYSATASYQYSCLTGSQNKVTVGSRQVVCVSSSGKVSGGVTVQAGGVLYVNGGTVSGGITASSPAGVNLCSENINGGVSISDATGPVVIGDGTSNCPGGTISGGLTLTNNSAGIQVIGNSITGGFTANNNSGSIPTGTPSSPGPSGQYVESNTGTGGMSCSANSPVLLDGGRGSVNTINGPRSGQCQAGF